ncbi:hypothetical protein [Fulvivirga lutimaris]|uniref:hypothetical protein n=1 Tax=Fulvivirga lutimaris TaxID=1819566 RepID=UPI0012BC6D5A|nr:hypothetical protein [Fulvivirga lutimaris]MTI39067.1 hypothetical protein [Fulvivirga lutimaris]
MNNYFKPFKILMLAILAAILFTACSDDDDVNISDTLSVQLANNAEFGNILVNQNNQTLYFFASDVTGESNCNGNCAAKWPPMLGDASDLVIASNLNAAGFTTITRADGEKQIAYKGWPLYYFSPAGDGQLEAAGGVTGDGAGNAFFVAKTDYTVMLGKQVVEEGADAVTYLVNDRGLTLYAFANDEEGVSNCTGGCANAWPIFAGQDNAIVPSVLNTSAFTSIDRSDDLGPQMAYNGKPLYYFVQDEDTRGNVTGNNGTFYVLTPEL